MASCFVIAPWNYPYMTAINTVAPALIAGNAVILKHATQTLLVGERMVRGLHEAGCPRTCSRTSVLDHDTTVRADRRRASTSSISPARSAAAGDRAGGRRHLHRLGLELGGKDPGYVMPDADLDWAVDVLMDGAMFNSGQCCCGIERIYVAASLYDAFVEKAVEPGSSGYKLGNPLDRKPRSGRWPMCASRRKSARTDRGGHSRRRTRHRSEPVPRPTMAAPT
jgi:acyl-CoA reductase-like NAD-dependent aldehyde dehydrogenase